MINPTCRSRQHRLQLVRECPNRITGDVVALHRLSLLLDIYPATNVATDSERNRVHLSYCSPSRLILMVRTRLCSDSTFSICETGLRI